MASLEARSPAWIASRAAFRSSAERVARVRAAVFASRAACDGSAFVRDIVGLVVGKEGGALGAWGRFGRVEKCAGAPRRV